MTQKLKSEILDGKNGSAIEKTNTYAENFFDGNGTI
jgi:hypothetical protein